MKSLFLKHRSRLLPFGDEVLISIECYITFVGMADALPLDNQDLHVILLLRQLQPWRFHPITKKLGD